MKPIINREFFNFILPPVRIINYRPKVDYDVNSVIFKNIVIYGFQGAGKTTAVNTIASRAVRKYGAENVNAVVSEDGDLELLLHFGLKPVLVNILFSDNLTLRRLERETLMDYFKVRHLYKKKFGLSNGYILSILALHRFHSIPVELRTTIDGILCLDSTMNPYDRSILKKFLGQEYLSFLDVMYSLKAKQPKLKKYAVFVSKDIKGLVSLPMARREYLKSISSYLQVLGDGRCRRR